jgi:hypothetical protein
MGAKRLYRLSRSVPLCALDGFSFIRSLPFSESRVMHLLPIYQLFPLFSGATPGSAARRGIVQGA